MVFPVEFNHLSMRKLVPKEFQLEKIFDTRMYEGYCGSEDLLYIKRVV